MSNDGSRLKDKRIEELKKMDELFESIDIKIKHVLGSEWTNIILYSIKRWNKFYYI